MSTTQADALQLANDRPTRIDDDLYEHDRATVTEMREYAGCVDRLHPAPLTEEALGVEKFAVLVLFAAAAAGVIWERRERSMGDGWFGAVFGGGLIGLCFGVGGLLAVGGVWWGVRHKLGE